MIAIWQKLYKLARSQTNKVDNNMFLSCGIGQTILLGFPHVVNLSKFVLLSVKCSVVCIPSKRVYNVSCQPAGKIFFFTKISLALLRLCLFYFCVCYVVAQFARPFTSHGLALIFI